MRNFLYNNIVSYDDITYVNGVGYASSATFNGLLRIEKDIAEIIGEFPGEHISKITLHHKQYLYKNKIYFMPDHAKSIHIYDLSTHNMRSIEFGNLEGYEDPVRGVDSFILGNLVYVFFEYANNPILLINLEEECIVKTIVYSIPEELTSKRTIPLFNAPFSYFDGSIYAAVWKEKYFFKFIPTEEVAYFIKVETSLPLEQMCVLDGKNFYFITEDSNILLHLLKKDSKYITDYIVRDCRTLNNSFCNIINFMGTIILVPNSGNYLCKVVNDEIIPYIKLPDNYGNSDLPRMEWRKHFSWSSKNEMLILCPYCANMKISISIKRNVCEGELIELDKYDYDLIKKKIFKSNFTNGIAKEKNANDLEIFIENI